MKSDEFKKYLLEIQLFECKALDPFKEQMLAGNYVFGYFENIDQLHDAALGSLASLTHKQIEHNLKKLTSVRMLFSHFDQTYAGLLVQSKTDLLTIDHLTKECPFELKFVDLKKIDEGFLKSFYDSFIYRFHSLVDLINKTEDFLTEKGLNENHPVEERRSYMY